MQSAIHVGVREGHHKPFLPSRRELHVYTVKHITGTLTYITEHQRQQIEPDDYN